MADVNSFVGKWCPAQAVEATEENTVQTVAQFFKDGSCTIPASMLGKDDLDFIFYQVFENGMMKLDSATMTPALFRCELTGDTMTLSAVDGSASFSFVKVKEEKRSLFKSKSSDAAPAKAKDVEPEPEPEPGEHEWKCPECGKINQNYVGTCGCGAAKPNDKLFSWAEVHPELVVKEEPVEEPIPEPEEKVEEKPAEPEREPDENEWKCPDCGKINLNYVGTCGCGASKPNDKLFNWAEVHPELVKKRSPLKSWFPSRKKSRRSPPSLRSSRVRTSGSARSAVRSTRIMSAPAAAARRSRTISCSTGRRYTPSLWKQKRLRKSRLRSTFPNPLPKRTKPKKSDLSIKQFN